MINEEIDNKAISLAVRVGKVSANTLKKALQLLIAQIEKSKTKTPDKSKFPNEPKLNHGKQTLKQLQKHNDGLSSVELTDPELRRLYRAMKKDNIDFAVVKDGKGKYTLFFKGKDADVMTHAFKKYTQKMVKVADKKAVRADLKAAKAAAQTLNTGRNKEKNRSKGAVER